MKQVKLPDSLSASTWTAVKNEIAKDKAVSSKVQGESTKMSTAVAALDKANRDFDFGLGDTKGLTAATAAGALDKFDKAANAAVKAVSDAASAAGKAASDVQTAVEKAGKGSKAATAAKNAFASAVKDASAFASAMSAAVDTARSELEAACKTLVNKQTEKKPANAPVKGNAKAQADAKFLSALMRKQIALLRTPKGPPMPVKFMVLFNKANPKDLRLYLGPRPETSLGKLKSQFPSEVKVTRVKDPKGQVVWEKGALTFLSDILKSGLARQVQLAIKALTKVNVKVRIKRSSGEVDEADAKDVSDEELAISPAEEAEMSSAGREWEATLAELKEAIDKAIAGPNGKKIKEHQAAVKNAGTAGKFDAAAEALDALQTALAEGDVAESDGKDLDAGDAGANLQDRLGELDAKIKKALERKDDTATKIAQFRDGALQFIKKADKASIDNASKFVDKIEELLAAAAASSFPADKVAAAREKWIESRDAAIKEITKLSKTIAETFAAQTEQKKIHEAVRQLGEVQKKLQTGLDNELNLAIKAKDPSKQANMVDRAKDSLASLRDLMDKDELLKNLDKNDVPGYGGMEIVKNMKEKLQDIEKVLPR